MPADENILKLPEILERKTVYRGRKIDLELLTIRTPDGHQALREVIRHRGAVVLLPITPDGQVVFVRNVRIGLGRVLLELPAGTIDEGESPADCAARELTEETGYTAGCIEPLVAFFTSPGVMSEKISAYVATGLQPGPQRLDEGEQLVTELIGYDEAIAMCRAGRFDDAKTIATLLTHWLRKLPAGAPTGSVP